MDEKPIQALKSKKDSSMVKAIALIKDHQADAMISCGNTGALMAGGTLRLRQIAGVDRPALGIIVPSKQNPFVLTDVGANPESTPENLVHNAVLGANYAKAALNMAVKTLAIEWQRSLPKATLIAYHPGTVRAALSEPFLNPASARIILSPEQAAAHCLQLLEAITPTDTGTFWDWQGQKIPW